MKVFDSVEMRWECLIVCGYAVKVFLVWSDAVRMFDSVEIR